jgi:hypothetical protein
MGSRVRKKSNKHFKSDQVREIPANEDSAESLPESECPCSCYITFRDKKGDAFLVRARSFVLLPSIVMLFC